MLNNGEGDCTIAGWGHLKLLRSTLAGTPVRLSDSDVQALYIAITALEGAAFNPATGDNDNGCVELDVLNYLRKQGQIGAFAAIDPSNVDHVKFAIDAFEGVYMGVELPQSAQAQDVWAVTDPALSGDAAPGSWGGHCMIVVDYDASHVTFVTWGTTQKATWEWWTDYVNRNVGGEAYAILSPDLVSGAKPAPSGFNLTQLQSDLAALG
jgi:hypothetical protein